IFLTACPGLERLCLPVFQFAGIETVAHKEQGRVDGMMGLNRDTKVHDCRYVRSIKIEFEISLVREFRLGSQNDGSTFEARAFVQADFGGKATALLKRRIRLTHENQAVLVAALE